MEMEEYKLKISYEMENKRAFKNNIGSNFLSSVAVFSSIISVAFYNCEKPLDSYPVMPPAKGGLRQCPKEL